VNAVSRKPLTKTYESKDPKSRNKVVITISVTDLVPGDISNRVGEVEEEITYEPSIWFGHQ